MSLVTNQGDCEIYRTLDRLRQDYPDPFRGERGIDELIERPDAQALLSDQAQASSGLLKLLRRTDDPDLARVAVVLISRLPPEEIYEPLLDALGRADAEMAHAYEPGLWRIAVSEQQLAGDLLRLVESTGNPYPLLVLQRPAARYVKAQLQRLAERRELPLSRLAFHPFRYTVDPGDAEVLRALTQWTEAPDVAAGADLALLDMSLPTDGAGIAAGLTAADEEVRVTTAYQLSRLLPRQALTEAGYDPRAPTGEAVEALLATLTR